jgi:hypothetical protein
MIFGYYGGYLQNSLNFITAMRRVFIGLTQYLIYGI